LLHSFGIHCFFFVHHYNLKFNHCSLQFMCNCQPSASKQNHETFLLKPWRTAIAAREQKISANAFCIQQAWPILDAFLKNLAGISIWGGKEILRYMFLPPLESAAAAAAGTPRLIFVPSAVMRLMLLKLPAKAPTASTSAAAVDAIAAGFYCIPSTLFSPAGPLASSLMPLFASAGEMLPLKILLFLLPALVFLTAATVPDNGIMPLLPLSPDDDQ
jgi:hypothetical protein